LATTLVNLRPLIAGIGEDTLDEGEQASGRLIGAIGDAVRKMLPEVTRIFVRPEPRTQATAAP
jgi:hypothetical protein